jgi:hypothetical protein
MTLPDNMATVYRCDPLIEIYLKGKLYEHKCLDFFRSYSSSNPNPTWVAYIESWSEPEYYYEARLLQRGKVEETYYLKVLDWCNIVLGNNCYILTMVTMSNVERLVRGFVKWTK